MKIVQLGQENCVGWRNCVDNWEVESGWNYLTLSGHGCFGSMKNLDDFSSWDCTFEYKDYCGALSMLYSCVRGISVGHEIQDTLQTHGS